MLPLRLSRLLDTCEYSLGYTDHHRLTEHSLKKGQRLLICSPLGGSLAERNDHLHATRKGVAVRIANIIKPSFLIGALLIGQPSTAREATVLDFGAQVSASPNLSKSGSLAQPTSNANSGERPSAEPLTLGMGISDLLLLEFARPSASPAIAIGPFGRASLPTDQISIPTWMKPSSTIFHFPVDRGTMFATGLAGGRYARCDAMPYAPAWWLDTRTEARRIDYFSTIAAVACEHGVPTALLDAIVAQESGYKSWAISPKGAMGLMQIMPGTANQLGLATPFDPTANLRAGARYLRMQLDRFGRVELALAAYNAGPHRRSLKAGRLPPISETLNYVRTIMINWGRLAPRSAEIVTVDRGAIAAAAVAASPLRRATLVRYDGLESVSSF